MRRQTRKLLQRSCALALLLLACATVGLVICFPGHQFVMAVRLATGLDITGLQAGIDDLEEKAICGDEFTFEDKAFLRDLYSCLAKGAKLTVVLRQSGQLMEHYLSGDGTPLLLDRRIFVNSRKVQEQLELLRRTVREAAVSDTTLDQTYSSGTFYMPDPSCLDSVFGLYYGKVSVQPRWIGTGKLLLTWRAEVPWEWPSYEFLKNKYGDYHAECFPLPNLRSLIWGRQHALFIDNGLGEYLAHIGLARPFRAYSEWEEQIFLD